MNALDHIGIRTKYIPPSRILPSAGTGPALHPATGAAPVEVRERMPEADSGPTSEGLEGGEEAEGAAEVEE